ncbi:hypothetical protein [Pseudomonas mandelii]|uniref:hypothetical protein n=1 Tax=Pseudomonas mandelii TaxID=75612 RepID=UPI00224B3FDD|nr:hypothetical protein [Pseudomonas mandelii]MCX2896779.1 hypothetical protein [Pseudomonas mandelii]
MPLNSSEAIKAQRLARLREEISDLQTDGDPESCSWRRPMIGGRMLELKELGIFDQDDFDVFNDEFNDALLAKKIASR